MEVAFDVKIEVKDLRNYMFCHKYKSVTGILEILIGIGALVYGIYLWTGAGKLDAYVLIWLFFGVYFLVMTPIKAYTNATKQYLLNPTYKDEFHYVLNENGITISQNGEEATLPWGEVYRVVDNGKSIIIYVSRLNANILPKRCFEDKVEEVKNMFRNNLDGKRVKL